MGEPDHRLLTALLGGADREDAESTAKRLLDHWSTLPETLAASFDALDRIAGHGVATRITAVRDLLVSVTLGAIEDRPLLASAKELHAYLQITMAHCLIEELRVFFLNVSNRLLRVEVMGQGTSDRLCFFPREILRRALELRASALILAHNHPGGGTSPSDADLGATHQLIELCALFDIEVHDHILVTRGGCRSLRALGLM